MKTNSRSIFLSVAALFTAGCASAPSHDSAIAGNQGAKNLEFTIPIQNQQANRPTLLLRVVGVKDHLMGKDVVYRPDSVRAAEVRDCLASFGAGLQEGLSSNATPMLPADCKVPISLSFEGDSNMHLASGVTKAALTGFFTLGLVGYIAPGEFSYRSKVTAEVLGYDGRARPFSAESQEVTVKYDVNGGSAAAAKAMGAARRQADTESLNNIAAQLAQSGIFQGKP